MTDPAAAEESWLCSPGCKGAPSGRLLGAADPCKKHRTETTKCTHEREEVQKSTKEEKRCRRASAWRDDM